MRFIRFVISRRHPESGVGQRVFSQAYALRDSTQVAEPDRTLLAETLEWFGRNLETPVRFNRTKSKGFYRRTTRGRMARRFRFYQAFRAFKDGRPEQVDVLRRELLELLDQTHTPTP